MIARIVSKIKDMVWRYQFKRTPTRLLGKLIVKEFRGSLYCVGTVDSEVSK
jgi:hypothetical protein